MSQFSLPVSNLTPSRYLTFLFSKFQNKSNLSMEI